jgi:hypothetical protein
MNELRVFFTLVQKTSDVSKTSDVWKNQQSFTINPLFRSGMQKQKRANKGLFNACTKDIGCSVTSDVWENQQSFYNQSFVQQWIAEAEKGEQGAV